MNVYESMSSYEMMDLSLGFREAMTSDVMNFISVVSAYLIVSYLAGAKLSRFQTSVITVLYTAMLTLIIYGTTVAALNFMEVSSLLSGAAPTPFPWVLCSVLVTGWVFSLIFMFQIRRRTGTSSDG